MLDWRGDGAGGRADIGFVFQEPTLMPWATVFDNVWLPLRLRGVSRAEAAPAIARDCSSGCSLDRLRRSLCRASFPAA